MANTYTTKLGLAKPANGDVDWHIPVNENWDKIDTELDKALKISGTTIDADKDWNGKAILNAGVIQNQTGDVGALSGFVDVPGNTTRKSVSSGVSLGQNESATVATVFVPNTYSSAVDSNLRVEISKSSVTSISVKG